MLKWGGDGPEGGHHPPRIWDVEWAGITLDVEKGGTSKAASTFLILEDLANGNATD